jgi:hypothetical protein
MQTTVLMIFMIAVSITISASFDSESPLYMRRCRLGLTLILTYLYHVEDSRTNSNRMNAASDVGSTNLPKDKEVTNEAAAGKIDPTAPVRLLLLGLFLPLIYHPFHRPRCMVINPLEALRSMRSCRRRRRVCWRGRVYRSRLFTACLLFILNQGEEQCNPH